MARTISASVGRMGGINRPPDVRTVQELLNEVPASSGGPSRPLVVTGGCGPETTSAIQTFQLRHFGWQGADGRVDPAGATLAKLNQFDTPATPNKERPPVPPVTPEPLSTVFNIRGAVYLLSEPPDGSPGTASTGGLFVPNCFQLVDLTNNRRALYTVAYPKSDISGERLGPSIFRRAPRTFRTYRPFALSELDCRVEYSTKVDWDDRKVLSRISWLDLYLAGGPKIRVPMYIHVDGAGNKSGRVTVTDSYDGNFHFAKFGHSVFGPD